MDQTTYREAEATNLTKIKVKFTKTELIDKVIANCHAGFGAAAKRKQMIKRTQTGYIIWT